MKIISTIKRLDEKLDLPNWLIILLFVVLFLRLPSFFEPFTYGDEMIYLVLGEGIRQGLTLYKDLHDNKPPLLYLVAAIAGNVFWFKVILAIWNMITIVIFYKFSKTLFEGKEKLQKTATVIFALLTTLPLLEGNIANAEIFMVGPTLLAFWYLLTKKQTFKNYFIAGTLFSLSSLFKIPASFDVPVIIVSSIIVLGIKRDSLKKAVQGTLALGLGFVTPILLTIIWYGFKNAMDEYLIAAFLQNIGYLSSWRPDDAVKPFYVRNGPLLVRSGIVFSGLLVLYIYRQKLSKQFIFLSTWLLFSLFAVTLSERPYPHYLIQSVPSISFLLAILLVQKNKEQTLSIIPLSLALFVPFYYKFWYYPTASYYTRFFSFATQKINRDQYFLSFDKNAVRNYKIADFIVKTTDEKERIFVWGDSPAIYALTRRFPPIKYVAGYHIKDFTEISDVVGEISVKKPSYIVLLPDDSIPSSLLAILAENYILLSTIDEAQIWHILRQQK